MISFLSLIQHTNCTVSAIQTLALNNSYQKRKNRFECSELRHYDNDNSIKTLEHFAWRRKNCCCIVFDGPTLGMY